MVNLAPGGTRGRGGEKGERGKGGSRRRRDEDADGQVVGEVLYAGEVLYVNRV